MDIMPGIYRDYEPAKYYADPCPKPSLTQSIAKIILAHSPLHAWTEHPRLGGAENEPDGYNKLLAIGEAAHALMIGRSRSLVVIESENFMTKAAKEAQAAAMKAGCIPILQKHYETARSMAIVAREQLTEHQACDAFLSGDGEVMIVWEDNGYWFRSLVDWLSKDLLVIDDYKTTSASVAPQALAAKAEADGWHIQAAMQEFILDHLDPDNAGRRVFRFIAQEQYKPHALSVLQMSEAWMTMGRKQLNLAIGKWVDAVRTGKWNGYPAYIQTPDFPQWAEKRWLDRELREEFDRAPYRVEQRQPARDHINGGMLGPDHIMAG